MFPEGSNTYAGLIVAIVPTILSVFGIHIVQQDQFNALLMDLISLIGTGYAFYGRARATTPGMFSKDSTASVTAVEPPVTPASPQ